MQRKLSEIAEIPKILSSTLATVSKTFDKLMPVEGHHPLHQERSPRRQECRKYSYDEDVVDYELSDNASSGDEDEPTKNAEEEEEEDGDRSWNEVYTFRLRQSKAKAATPESDYASEAINSGEEDSDDSEDPEVEFDEDSEDNPTDNNDNEGEDETEDDFLSTTFTWNLRNVPKIRLNDGEDGDCSEDDAQDTQDQGSQSTDGLTAKEGVESQESCHSDVAEKPFKLEKLERFWPWADRQKIIYKQSTCHLVPRQPLGLVEQRKQLLAKRNLIDNLQKRRLWQDDQSED